MLRINCTYTHHGLYFQILDIKWDTPVNSILTINSYSNIKKTSKISKDPIESQQDDEVDNSSLRSANG